MVFTPQKQPTSYSWRRWVRLKWVLQTDVLTKIYGSKSGLCKVVGYASGVGLLPVALSPSFQDKGVGTGPAAT